MLLDEPTNHLDIDGIVRLENLLARQPSAIVVTHDRAFLDRFATRIIELDRGRLYSFPGNFTSWEQRKAQQLASEAIAQRRFDKFWAPSETLLQNWVRRNIREVAIPIPGSSKKIRCVVSLLQLGGACGIDDPNMQDQEATARPPPDIPFKPELQEDQDALRKPGESP